MSTIVHFDVGVENIDRAKAFYEKLFDWKIEKLPGPMEYYEIKTFDDEGNEKLGGGMTQRQDTNQHITNYVGVENIDDYIENVKQLGGKITTPKTLIPGFGFLAVCLDTENNTIGLWEEKDTAH
jgi:predicted enzyme related to lactoylglutathione lyase